MLMKTILNKAFAILSLAFGGFVLVTSGRAQPAGPQRPRVVSPEVAADRKVTFRIDTPRAETVQLTGNGGSPGIGFRQAKAMTKGDDGGWTVTVGPLDPGPIAKASTWMG